MGEIKTGGPAFPHGDPTNGGDLGMTLRDYFAGQALAGMWAGAMSAVSQVAEEDGRSAVEQAARAAYGMADAMLAAREGAHHD